MPIHKTVLKPTRFGAVLCCLKTGRSLTSRPIAARKNKRRSIRSDRSRSGRDSIHRPLRADFLLGGHLWHFSTVQSRYCRLSSWPSEPVSVSGGNQPDGRLRQRQPRRQVPGNEAADGRRRCRPHRNHSGSSAFRSVRLIIPDGRCKPAGREVPARSILWKEVSFTLGCYLDADRGLAQGAAHRRDHEQSLRDVRFRQPAGVGRGDAGGDYPGELLTRSIRSCEECLGIGDHSHCGPDPHVHRLL